MGTLPRLQAHLSYLLLCITNIFFNLQLIEVLIYISIVETMYFTGKGTISGVGQMKIRKHVDPSHSLGSYLYGKHLDA